MTVTYTFRTLCAAVVLLAAARPAFSQDNAPSQSRPGANEKDETQEELTPAATKAAEQLRQSLPDGSEGRAMLEQILEGSRLGPGEGWFPLAVSQTRYAWPTVRQCYDSDEDGAIAREEFAGSDADFKAVDRDDDGKITEGDLDWKDDALERTPGMILFYQADADSNGKVTRAEFKELFDRLDSDSAGYLSLEDLRDRFQPVERERRSEPRIDRPSRSTLVLGLQRQEIGSLQPGPALGETAPDFTLKSLGGQVVTLSKETGPRPVVLVFGNFTCGPFRSQSGNVEKLFERYRERATFLMVYVREAHPEDGWWMQSNHRVGINVTQPTTDDERREVAQRCRGHLNLSLPFLVDTVDDRVGAAYSGMPSRLYLLDSAGKVAYKSGRGPFGFKPAELEQSLVLLLNDPEHAGEPAAR